jgi:hypothetical protein
MIYGVVYQLAKVTALVSQVTIAASENTPSADTFTDSANGFVSAGFQDGDLIDVQGFTDSDNNGEFTIDTVVAGTITLVSGDDLATEAAGGSITIRLKRKAYVSSTAGGEIQSDQFYQPSIMNMGRIGFDANEGYAKIRGGSMTLAQADFSGWELDQRNVGGAIYLSETSDLLFSGTGIVTSWNPVELVVQFKAQDFSGELLSQAPDINTTATYTNGRFFPRAYGRQTHRKPLLLDDTAYHYHSGYAAIEHVYDDGVAIEIKGVQSAYAPTGTAVQYNALHYTSTGTSQTTSPTGGATSNADWTYVGAATAEPQFQCLMGTGTYTAGSFQLKAAPVGTVTFSGIASDYKFTDVMDHMVTLLGLTLDTTNADTSSATQINHWISSQTLILEVMKQYAMFHEHIFRLDDTTITLVDKTGYDTLHTFDETQATLNGEEIEFRDIPKRFKATWKTNIARANPQEITEEEHSVTVTTDALEGRELVVPVYDDDSGRITVALQKKRDLENDSITGNVTLTRHRTEILPGDQVDFAGEFGSGEMFIIEAEIDLMGYRTRARGIINNFVRT